MMESAPIDDVVTSALVALAGRLRTHHDAGLARLLTEDTVRWFLIEELLAGGISSAGVKTEVPVRHDGGRLDLVVHGRTGPAAFELKFPRDASGAADTMAVGEIVNDLVRLSRLPDYEPCWFVVVLCDRFAGYLDRRPYWDWPTVPGAVMTFNAADFEKMPETARRSAHRRDGFEALVATARVVEPVGFGTLLAMHVNPG